MQKENDATAHHDDVDDDDLFDFEDIEELKELQLLEDELKTSLYQVGYDAGFLNGYKSGQSADPAELDDATHNTLIDMISTYIENIEVSTKEDILVAIRSLRK